MAARARMGLLAVAVAVAALPVSAQRPVPPGVDYVRAIDPASVRRPPSLFSRMLRAIAGRADTPVMAQPYGLSVGPDGQLYVVDSAQGVIHVYGLDKPSYRALHVGGETLIGIAFNGPQMFVSDSAGDRLMALDLSGRRRWSLDKNDGLLRPTGLASCGDRLYVVDTLAHKVLIVGLDGRIRGGFGRRGSLPGQFNFPSHVACDERGRVYVNDTMNFRVQVFDAAGAYLSTFGQLGDAPGDFDKPKGVAVDRDGHVYVVEGLHDAVQIFDEQGRLLLAFGGSGQGPGELWLPAGIAIVSRTIYVADTANHRVQVFERVGDAR